MANSHLNDKEQEIKLNMPSEYICANDKERGGVSPSEYICANDQRKEPRQSIHQKT